MEDNYLYAEGDLNLLKTIKKLIKANDLEEVSHNILNRNKTKSNIVFYVNKQAMYYNNFHIIDEDMSLLGDIEVNINSDDIESIIDRILS